MPTTPNRTSRGQNGVSLQKIISTAGRDVGRSAKSITKRLVPFVARRRGVPADSKNVSRQDPTSLAEALRLPTLHEQIQEAMEYKDNNEKFLGKEFSTDDEIRDQFNPLFGGIHAWSESFSRHRGAGQTDAQLKDLYDWQVSTLASEKERQLFAHSLVTRFLCNTVFRTYDKDLSVSSVTGKDYWLDENSRAALEALESRLYASSKGTISFTSFCHQ